MELTPEELLLVALVRRAIKDAQKAKRPQEREEAMAWLWWVAPCVAERAEVQRENSSLSSGLDEALQAA